MKTTKTPTSYKVTYSTHTPLKIASVDFRDGQQSLIATRMRTEDMLPILPLMDDFGFSCFEMWGGATFDSCIRFLNEDPWERLRQFKSVAQKTPLRMLLRGQNLLGYVPYPDDIVERFVMASAKNGIDIFLIFDGLNDIRNCAHAAKIALREGKTVEGLIEFTRSPVHTIESFVETAKEFVAIGASRVYLEDMGGMMDPVFAGETVKAIRETVDIPVGYHAHCCGGMTEIAYWEVIKAGADIVDTDISTFALTTAHPSAESMIAIMEGTERDTGLDYRKLAPVSAYMKKLREKYKDNASKLVGADVGVIEHQVPGGMRSNLEMQLAQMGIGERIDEVLAEVAVVHRDMGYPPLGTPFSQMCGVQAAMNVITGERYSIIPTEVENYVKGRYGKVPGVISPELYEKVLEPGETVLTMRPADLLEPGYERAKNEIGCLAKTEEDILTYALFPVEGKGFLQRKYKE